MGKQKENNKVSKPTLITKIFLFLFPILIGLGIFLYFDQFSWEARFCLVGGGFFLGISLSISLWGRLDSEPPHG